MTTPSPPSPSLDDLPFDIHSLHAAYANGLAPGDVMREVLRRHAAVNDPGIFIHLFNERELLAAVSALGAPDLERMPLWGIPFAVKDNIDVGGVVTTAACPAFAYEASEDAYIVAALRAAGAIVVGKTNLDQFATGLVGTRTPWPVPRNAFHPDLVPGGSSSGSAVAVAHGIVSFALGTDTAGSGRVPAALNNIVGLKPTPGRLSARGVVPACRTLDTVSFFALNVQDAQRAMRHAGGHDVADPYSFKTEEPRAGSIREPAIVGVPDEASLEFFDDAQAQAAWTSTLDGLRQSGAQLEPVNLRPFLSIAQLLYTGSWIAERHSVVAALLAASPEALHPVTRQIIGAAEHLSATEAFRDQYRLQELLRDCEPALARLDFLAVPSIPTVCTLSDIERNPIEANSRLGHYTNFANLMKMAAIALPLGDRGDGMPHGMTLLAPRHHDMPMIDFARRLARLSPVSPGVTGWAPDLPPERPDDTTAHDDEISLAVVGAHLTGMPLNHQLTTLGARLLRTTRTSSHYNLLALPGGPPFRPALVRVPESPAATASIALEVWAMPRAHLADFVASIAPPLGIGTVWLEDNSTTLGFICEPAALQGATDITRYGGWRAYVENAAGSPSANA